MEALTDVAEISTDTVADSVFTVPAGHQAAPFEQVVQAAIQAPVTLPGGEAGAIISGGGGVTSAAQAASLPHRLLSSYRYSSCNPARAAEPGQSFSNGSLMSASSGVPLSSWRSETLSSM